MSKNLTLNPSPRLSLAGLVALAGLLLLAPAVLAATAEELAAEPAENFDDGTEQAILPVNSFFCTLLSPGQVERFTFNCPAATQVDVSISDGFIPGDHWEAKAKIWDAAPNTAVATSPGPVIAFGGNARVFNYGGTTFNAAATGLIECSYLHGINVFPASSIIQVTPNAGACTVTNVGVTTEIHRSP